MINIIEEKKNHHAILVYFLIYLFFIYIISCSFMNFYRNQVNFKILENYS